MEETESSTTGMGDVACRPISGGYTRSSSAVCQSMEQVADNELRKMILP